MNVYKPKNPPQSLALSFEVWFFRMSLLLNRIGW